MPDDLRPWRRFYAEEVAAVANLRTPGLVAALADVPREAFLPRGPWVVKAEGDIGGPPRHTADDDPRHVYHNVSVALDASRTLFNGAPGVVGLCIDALSLRPGDRVLHVGCGRGYYSAVMGHCVGPEGRVVAVEVDEPMAAEAQSALAAWPNVDVQAGNGVDGLPGGTFDAILVNAGMSHPHEAWLGALKPGGRLVLPLTASVPQMGPIGKGLMTQLTRPADPATDWSARVVTFVMIYSAVGIRDTAMNDRMVAALRKSPWPSFTRLRRDGHDEAASCWLHGPTACLSA